MKAIRGSRYEIVEDVVGEALRIRDIGPWNIYLSVTNDAENVVHGLFEQGLIPNNRRLLYFDTEGVVSELLHREGRFIGFAAYPRHTERDRFAGWAEGRK